MQTYDVTVRRKIRAEYIEQAAFRAAEGLEVGDLVKIAQDGDSVVYEVEENDAERLLRARFSREGQGNVARDSERR